MYFWCAQRFFDVVLCSLFFSQLDDFIFSYAAILNILPSEMAILSSKANSNTWESFTRSELKLESVHQESPRSDIFRKRATKPLLKQKYRQEYLTWAKEKNNCTVAQWSKVLFSDESTFYI